MRRGTDESHIESMGEAADPIIVTKGNMFVGLTSQESAYSYKNGKWYINWLWINSIHSLY